MVSGAAGMAGELGHVQIPLFGVLEEDQPVPQCNCGFEGDVESIASLTGIKNNLLPYWLTKFPDHPLAGEPIKKAAKLLRGYGEQNDPLALAVFGQQAKAIGKLFTIAANFTDPSAYFLGGGVVEAAPQVPAVVPQHRPRTHAAAARADGGGDLRPGPGPRHGRRAGRRGGRSGPGQVQLGLNTCVIERPRY